MDNIQTEQNGDVQNLILGELQSLRADYNTNARETGERLTSLEVQVSQLLGNGQPGRISNIEADIQALKGWKQSLIGLWGVMCAVGSVVGSAGMFIVQHLHWFHLF
jgi:hypothetical protein